MCQAATRPNAPSHHLSLLACGCAARIGQAAMQLPSTSSGLDCMPPTHTSASACFQCRHHGLRRGEARQVAGQGWCQAMAPVCLAPTIQPHPPARAHTQDEPPTRCCTHNVPREWEGWETSIIKRQPGLPSLLCPTQTQSWSCYTYPAPAHLRSPKTGYTALSPILPCLALSCLAAVAPAATLSIRSPAASQHPSSPGSQPRQGE